MRRNIYLKKHMLVLLVLLLATPILWAGNVTVKTQDHAGNAISGVFKIWLGPNYLGQWNGGETVNLDEGETYKIKAIYNATSSSKFHTVNGDASLDFKTTKVTLHFSGGYCNYQGSGSWKPFQGSSMELYPKDFYGNTMKFQFGKVWNDTRYMYKTIDYEGETSIEKTIAILQLRGHDGNPISGGKAIGGYTSPSSWHVTGTTDSDGLLLDCRDGNLSQLTYKMMLNNGEQIVGPQDPSGNSYFEFETELVTLRLEKCDGTPLNDGKPRFGSGASYGTSFWPNGNTGLSAPGETTAELFPGTYSFDMLYNGTSDQKVSQVVADGGATFTWQTTQVTLMYSGAISYGGNGDSRYFNKPTMDLLPGTYNFNFRSSKGNFYTPLTFSGCEFGGNVYTFKVKNEAGDGVANIPIYWHYNTNYNNTYKKIGQTDANGMLFSIGDVTKTGSQPFKAVYNQTSQRKETSDNIEFQTATATALIVDHNGDPLEGKEVRFQYHSGYSNLFVGLGKTDAMGKASVELFPGDYNFKAFVNRTSSDKTFTLSYNTAVDVTFQTERATALVQNCDEEPISGVLVEFLWHNRYTNDPYRLKVGTTGNDGKASIELFESDNLKFRAKLNHTYSLKTFDLAPNVDVDVEFNPTLVNMNYAGSVKWKYNNYYYTDVTSDYYMFPGTYNFKFSGADNFTGTYNLDVIGCEFGGNVYIFKVKNEAGDGIADVPIEWHYNTNYGNTYKPLGKTDANGLLFSVGDVTKTGSQPFKADYNKTSQRKLTAGYLEFQTTVATALVETCEEGPIAGVLVEYLWHNRYTNDGYRINVGTTDNDGKASIELFESDNLKFRAKLNHTYSLQTFDLEPNVDVDVEFNPTLVNMNYAGNVQWKYNNYYYTAVSPDYLMFPGTYKFRFSGADDFTGTYTMDVSGCKFGGNVYIFKVKNEAGEGIAGIPVSWHYNTNYGNTYKEIGTTDVNGLLFSVGDVGKTGSQPFKAVLNKTSQRKLTSGYTEFQIATATALVVDHNGNPMAGKEVRFQYHSGYSNLFVELGNTDATGKASVELFPGDYNFKAFVSRTSSEKTFTLSYNTPVDVTFQTELATALVHDEEPIAGALVEFLWHDSYTNPGFIISVGTTGNDGKASIELFESDNLKFRAKFNDTYIVETFNLEPNVEVDVYFDFEEGLLKQDIVENAPNISFTNIYPNPVRGAARIQYNLEQDNTVNISVYNSIGVEVERLISSAQMQGNQELIWNTQNLEPGMYYIRINIGNQQNVKPVIVQ